ncbi:TIGR01906 family membrane protein [Terrisporobacter sp.]|uniref:TIGR01906 family membrane protein n=1 Tax=Terrisporobacter sp. TaxID=1965305 RepID=UPI00260B78C7|nr:TIGR01906 family membrane protein [Terrisporobacter sp.]
MKKILNIMISISLAIFIISGSVILGLKFKSIYYKDISKLNISSLSGLSEDEIKLNYDYLIDYNLNNSVGEFKLPTIKYSKEGKIHFEEVRNIFQFIKKVFYISFVISLVIIIFNIKNRNIKFLKYSSIMTILLPIITAIPVMINFNYFFIKFHQIVFSNDYWIFDPEVDPVINILPQEVFFHIGIFILIIMLLISILLQIAYRLIKKKMKI